MTTTAAAAAAAAPVIIDDDKSPICIPFILSLLARHRALTPDRPFIIGLNGVQGVGKTTLVESLSSTLTTQQGLATAVVSLDDFYLTHADQAALADSQPDNALVSCRGEPGTHDLPLARAFFNDILAGNPTKIPHYDKSAFQGSGDRADPASWPSINSPGSPKIQVLILEGWAVGFRALDAAAVAEKQAAEGNRTLRLHKLEHLQFVNQSLRAYDAITDLFDAFIHLDAEDTLYVYDWRIEQEAKLRLVKGTGMTDEQVVKFVDAYYPAYELFSDNLRLGLFPDKPGHQLRLTVAKDRKVKDVIVI